VTHRQVSAQCAAMAFDCISVTPPPHYVSIVRYTYDVSCLYAKGCPEFSLEYLCSVILPVVLYGCETWSLTLREEHRLRVFENRFMRRIFGPKRDEVTGEWTKFAQ
jgi:hypothetical protein